jgi:hypothetical protein
VRGGDAMKSETIQTMWVGRHLGVMQRMSLASFVEHGHDIHLYTYGPVDHVPAGVVTRDGNDILPERAIFAYRQGFGKGSYAAFSNFFRYKLLLERGGWWVDTDVVCLRPFDFAAEHVFASEALDSPQTTGIASAIIKAPAGSEVMAYTWEVCTNKDTERLMFNEVGPSLMTDAVRRFGLERYVQPPVTFCPVHWYEWDTLRAAGGVALAPEARAVHLWNEMWRHHGADPDLEYPASSVYGSLRRRLLGDVA